MNRCAAATTGLRVLLIAALCLASCSPSTSDSGNFEQHPFTLADYGLFDLGVADFDNDGRLDIFTVNHSGEQGFLLNQGADGFRDVYAAWKLDQDRHFPGLAIFPAEPAMEKPGVYINWIGPDVVVRTRWPGGGPAVSGRIEVLTSVKVMEKQHFSVTVTEATIAPDVPQAVIAFSGQGDGFFRFRPLNHALPFRFQFDEPVDAASIRVGKHQVAPDSPEFTFQLRDRHGMVWGDFNRDDRTDLFITRGGERGMMEALPIPFWDELFVGTADGMQEIGIDAGLNKNGCPGRQAGMVDVNQDNRLDLYVVCGRNPKTFANMLFEQTADGRFADRAADAGLAIPTNGSFVWLDIDRDGDMDLFWSDANGYFIYRNETGRFQPTAVDAFRRNGFGSKFSVADFDNDGDLDIFSATLFGNVLFVNADGRLSAVMPATIGLPDKSTTANWVDYDNDGRMDLHALPDGLFVQRQPSAFQSAGQLGVAAATFSPFHSIDARCAWVDVDNNGTRDLLMATQWQARNAKWAKWWVKAMNLEKDFGGLPYGWKVAFFDNRNTGNHWLQVHLNGPPGNRQALGARVTLLTTDGSQVQQVGQAEGSHFSQGHYRLYFGLGRESAPAALRVDWPGGRTTEIADPPVDRLLTIDWQEG